MNPLDTNHYAPRTRRTERKLFALAANQRVVAHLLHQVGRQGYPLLISPVQFIKASTFPANQARINGAFSGDRKTRHAHWCLEVLATSLLSWQRDDIRAENGAVESQLEELTGMGRPQHYSIASGRQHS